MKKQGGFTLIELVVVIVILGILAVTAAPRFLNLQSDARESSLQGLKGAMAGAGSIVYGKAAIEGVERKDYTKETAELKDGTELQFGYPRATVGGLVAVVQGLDDSNDWAYALDATQSQAGLVATFAGTDVDTLDEINATGCYVSFYEAATSVATPSIAVTDSGC
ncbi:MSHA biogenesis protein MshA [Vibrio sp. UCD-FRSSP16_10]|uniref:type II secretion system protein n=1 Tax=unclassified Vibrio TaxID=2614977 RepID=UPI000801034D|nr:MULTISPECIES: type II secretion system protein [unclassified Vibrio]OBT17441.1 MSHA biogenesis protein MshA [Vibrio sp. UCD-FRSSP16_30]OBT23210.1 MSHA biogenesis protein MshA [Vibrio sp. UCD-FRSSP16_10]